MESKNNQTAKSTKTNSLPKTTTRKTSQGCLRPITVKRWNSFRLLRMSATDPALTLSSAGNSQGPLQVFPATVCKKEHPLLLSSFSVCKMMHPVDFQETVQRWFALLVGPGHTCTYSFFTSHRGTRLTKPKETVPGRQLESPSIPVVISPDFILHIIPNWLDLLVRVSSHAPQPNTISALSPPDTTLKGATAGEQCPTCQPPCACYSSSPWKHQATQ